MGDQEPVVRSHRFGQYLRRIREDRKLSLDAVEELTLGYPGRVTKSHLSRIENGQAEPTFPRMFALSQIYGVPISMLAEKFEIDLMRHRLPGDLDDVPDEEIRKRADDLSRSGRNDESLLLVELLIERHGRTADSAADPGLLHGLELERVNRLIQLARYGSAKDRCERLVNRTDISRKDRALSLYYLAVCCLRLDRLQFAIDFADAARDEIAETEGTQRVAASLENLRGNVLLASGRPDEAQAAYRQAMALFEALGNPWETCRARLNFAAATLEVGDPDVARAELTEVIRQSETAGYDRYVALGLSHLGLIDYRSGAFDAAESCWIRSNAIARSREYIAVVFRNCYYLRQIARVRDDDAACRSHERTMRSLLGRVDRTLAEVQAFKAELGGMA